VPPSSGVVDLTRSAGYMGAPGGQGGTGRFSRIPLPSVGSHRTTEQEETMQDCKNLRLSADAAQFLRAVPCGPSPATLGVTRRPFLELLVTRPGRFR